MPDQNAQDTGTQGTEGQQQAPVDIEAQIDAAIAAGADPFEAMMAAEGRGAAAVDASIDEMMAAGEYADGTLGGDLTDDDGTDPQDPVDQQVEATQETQQAQAPEAPKADEDRGARQRVVQRLTSAEARIVELERENRELRSQPQGVQGFRPSGDIVDDMEQLAIMYAGKDATSGDPRVKQQLQYLGRGALALLQGEDDPEFRTIQQERAQRRQQAEVQRQIDELRQDRDRLKGQSLRASQVQMVAAELPTVAPQEEHPYAHAAEGADLPSRVMDGIDELVRGGYRIVTDREARDAIAFVMGKLEAYHRAHHERITAAVSPRPNAGGGQNQPNTPTSPTNVTRGAQQDRAGHRTQQDGGRRTSTVTAAAIDGGRRAPDQAGNQSPATKDPFEELLKDDLAERKRSAAARARRQ